MSGRNLLLFQKPTHMHMVVNQRNTLLACEVHSLIKMRLLFIPAPPFSFEEYRSMD